MAHHKGTSTFVLQRATAVLLLPLIVYLMVSLVAHAGDDAAQARAWLSDLGVSVPLALIVAVGVFHGRIGLSEIITDYIHSWMKDVLQVVVWMAAIAIVAVVFWAAYELSFAG